MLKTFTFLIFHTKFLVTIKVPAHSYLDTDEDKMSPNNFAFLPFFNEEVLPSAQEWMGGEDDQRRNAPGTGGNQDVSTDGDVAPRRPIVEEGESCLKSCFGWCFSKEPLMTADVEYDGDIEDDEETPLVVRRRTTRRRRRQEGSDILFLQNIALTRVGRVETFKSLF